MKKIIITSLVLFFHFLLFSNVAQPGIMNAGGAGSFSLLFKEDQADYKRIQMEKEQISIQLYKGFAVVKGVYWMKNDSNDTITINAGYPIDAYFESYKNNFDLTEIVFDQLYQLQVIVDGEKVDYQKKEITTPPKNINTAISDQSNWYVWKNSFKPNGLTKIEVFFIVNTNNSFVREGYDSKHYNAFIYVLETGATWKAPIEEGKIAIQLMDGLSSKNIEGVSSTFDFNHIISDNIIYTSFKKLVPTHENNIVLTYNKKVETFNFEKVIAQSDRYFQAINSLSDKKYDSLNSKPISFDSPFNIPNPGGYIIVAIFFIGLYGVPLFIGLFILYVIYRLVKRSKGKTV